MGLDIVLDGFYGFGNGQIKRSAFVGYAAEPDLPAVTIDYLFAGGQANARAGVFVAAVQPLKQLKTRSAYCMQGNADAVVPNGKLVGIAPVDG